MKVTDTVSSPLLLRAEEAARLLGLGRTTLFVMLAAGELPVIRIGRAVRIPRVALDQWIAAHVEGDPARMQRIRASRPQAAGRE